MLTRIMFFSTKNTYNIVLIPTDHEFFENIQKKKKKKCRAKKGKK